MRICLVRKFYIHFIFLPEDCPGTLAEIRNHGKKSGTYELDERTVTVLDDGPIFSRGNIVISDQEIRMNSEFR